MSMRLLGRLGVVAGVIVLVVSLAANPLGIGWNPREFGWLQTLGSVIGALAIAGGLWLAIRED